MLSKLALLTLLIVYCCDAYVPRFFRGRPRDGFVGSPGLSHLTRTEIEKIRSNLAPDQWFEQRLDHFDSSNTQTWKQRYYTNAEFHKEGGPLFVMIGGEGTASPFWMQVGQWIEMAKQNNAYCVQLEHRFYGKSHPTPNTSVENLAYLSSEQALADLAAFISSQKALTKAKKVITFGGSYPGSLSAWFRLKYPHLVDGAVSSSAPLLAEVNFQEYLQVVTASLNSTANGEQCLLNIGTATSKITKMLDREPGRRKIKKMFRLCDPIDVDKKLDVINLFATLADNIAGVVQYNKDNVGAYAAEFTIDTVCGIMNNQSFGGPLARYAKLNSVLLDFYYGDCLNYVYENMIEDLKKTSWESTAAEGGRQWTYQTCTEFGWYQSSDNKNQPFGHAFSIDFWTNQCGLIFGDKYSANLIQAAVNRSNIDYGALDVQYDHVVFVNGLIDPWHALGRLTQAGSDQAIVIPDTAHCANMYPSSPRDSEALIRARAKIAKLVSGWVNE